MKWMAPTSRAPGRPSTLGMIREQSASITVASAGVNAVVGVAVVAVAC
jgi:hypothetical protein